MATSWSRARLVWVSLLMFGINFLTADIANKVLLDTICIWADRPRHSLVYSHSHLRYLVAFEKIIWYPAMVMFELKKSSFHSKRQFFSIVSSCISRSAIFIRVPTDFSTGSTKFSSLNLTFSTATKAKSLIKSINITLDNIFICWSLPFNMFQSNSPNNICWSISLLKQLFLYITKTWQIIER